jgi:hypothetical protein
MDATHVENREHEHRNPERIADDRELLASCLDALPDPAAGTRVGPSTVRQLESF